MGGGGGGIPRVLHNFSREKSYDNEIWRRDSTAKDVSYEVHKEK